jgi:hypothetical protein
VPVRSESNNGAVRTRCTVGALGMTEHVKLRVVRGKTEVGVPRLSARSFRNAFG